MAQACSLSQAVTLPRSGLGCMGELRSEKLHALAAMPAAILFEDVVVVLLSKSGFRVKTPVCLGLGSSDACAVLPPEGVVVELRCSRA